MKYEEITYSHEHMVIDLQSKGSDDCYLNVAEDALDELMDLKQKGVVRIIDCSNRGIGRNIAVIKELSEKTGIDILWSTGYYKDPFFPEEVTQNSVEELCERMIHDIQEGAAFIGEIGTSNNEITALERKVFLASCMVHQVTKKPIITHTTLGTMAEEQVQIFQEHHVDLNQVILSHTALKNDEDMMLRLLSKGVYLAFDTIGKKSYLSDERRCELILSCCRHGFGDQLLLSMDLTRKSHLKKNKGVGYAYLIDHFIPMLEKNGVEPCQIKKMVSENIYNFIGRGK